MKVSIIIPVYNVAHYIRRCLSSVMAQTYSGPIECILVDDASPDNSMAIASELLASYSGPVEFKTVTHPANKGLSGARNTGACHASGDYIYFLDSDDEITPGCIAALVAVAEAHPGVDVVQGNIVVTDEFFRFLDNNLYVFPSFSNDSEWIGEHILTDIPVTAWNKLFRRDFFVGNGLWFKEGVLHEDEHWRYIHGCQITSIAFCNTPSYIYYRNSGSITETSRKDRNFASMLTIMGEYLPTITRKNRYAPVIIYLHSLTKRLDELSDPEAFLERYNALVDAQIASPHVPQSVKASFRYMRRPSLLLKTVCAIFLRRSYRIIRRMQQMDAAPLSPKKRLLFLICALLDGGIDTMLVEYLRNINLDRFDVTLAIGMKMDQFEVHRAKIPRGVRVEYLVDAPALTRCRKAKFAGTLSKPAKLYDELLLNPVRKLTSARRLKRLVNQSDAVIDFDATFYSSLRRCPRPVVGFYHFSIAENLARSRRHTLRQMHGMERYSHIALICDAMIDEGVRLFPALAPKFTRIYNGYNFDTLHRRAEAPLPVEAPPQGYFLSVARLEESQKDITTLLKAYARLRSLAPDPAALPHLWLLGEGRDRATLETLARTLAIDPYVRFMGFHPDAAPFIARSMAVVHSSKYEGLPLALIEAVVLQRPVIASDCPTGPAEILNHGNAGILVPPGDSEAMAEAMLRVATDPRLRSNLSHAAAAHSTVFDINTSLSQLLNLLDL